MKRNLLIIINLCMMQFIYGQTQSPENKHIDAFCAMVTTVHSLDALGFNSHFKEKRVFETDTLNSSARVLVKKKGANLSFIRIIPEEGEKELLFCNDTAWVVDHQLEKLDCIGTSTDDLAHNNMASFFPFTVFTIDTAILLAEPFWHITEINREYSIISLDINNHSEDVSDIRVEFTTGNHDHLLYKTLKEFVYLKSDKAYEEQILSDFTFPVPDEIKFPEYFTIYGKDLSIFNQHDHAAGNKPKPTASDVFLENIELFDLSGNSFRLPEEGLIFFDLWYVGCAPCMKSAPVIEKVYESYKDQVYFLSVNEIDRDTAKISNFLEKMGITMPVLLGGKEKIGAKVTRRGGYPVFFLMDAETRKVLWSMEGFADNLEEIINEELKKYL
jgi:thiol-disulfide isomerase/thioredoxin